jgi:GTPase
MTTLNFKSGFANIVGLPNVGKSSLINFLLDERLSIVNSKSQTTRQNIKGFVHHQDYQLILVDTPGFIDEPAYQLQLSMNSYIELALEETDVVLFVVDKYNKLEVTHPLLNAIKTANKKTILVINKVDQCTPEEVVALTEYYSKLHEFSDTISLSVELKYGRDALLNIIVGYLPVHPAYYDTEDYTDRNMRFFVSEIIREKIFSTYQKEIPYSSEVVVTKYHEKPEGTIIEATIYVERESQKKIVIGHNAEKLKKISIDARREIETYTDAKVHLFIFVRVLENWRSKDKLLEKLGYLISTKKSIKDE